MLMTDNRPPFPYIDPPANLPSPCRQLLSLKIKTIILGLFGNRRKIVNRDKQAMAKPQASPTNSFMEKMMEAGRSCSEQKSGGERQVLGGGGFWWAKLQVWQISGPRSLLGAN